jgi:hypothetical protein
MFPVKYILQKLGDRYDSEKLAYIESALRIIFVRTDLIRYENHFCSDTQCFPRGELYYINQKLLLPPEHKANIYVCKYYVVHICKSDPKYHPVEEILIPSPLNIVLRFNYSCTPITNRVGDYCQCSISQKFISSNWSTIDFDVSFSVSPAQGSIVDVETPVDDDGEESMNPTHMDLGDDSDFQMRKRTKFIDNCHDLTREYIRRIFIASDTREFYRAIRDKELDEATKLIIQNEKTALNAKLRPNLCVIIANLPAQFKNIFIDPDFPPPDNDLQDRIVKIVDHCIRLFVRAYALQKSNRNNEQLLHTINAARFILTAIYSMRSGIAVNDCYIIPSIPYVTKYAPRITLLFAAKKVKINVINEQHLFITMCNFLLVAGVPLSELEYNDPIEVAPAKVG